MDRGYFIKRGIASFGAVLSIPFLSGWFSEERLDDEELDDEELDDEESDENFIRLKVEYEGETYKAVTGLPDEPAPGHLTKKERRNIMWDAIQYEIEKEVSG